MTLPIDLSCAVWLVAKAIWETEEAAPESSDVGQGPACTGDGAQPPPNGDYASDSPAASVSSKAPTAPRLVFKGYIYETQFNWTPAESPISRPWQQALAEDHDRRNRIGAKPGLPDPVPPLDDDAALPK